MKFTFKLCKILLKIESNFLAYRKNKNFFKNFVLSELLPVPINSDNQESTIYNSLLGTSSIGSSSSSGLLTEMIMRCPSQFSLHVARNLQKLFLYRTRNMAASSNSNMTKLGVIMSTLVNVKEHTKCL